MPRRAPILIWRYITVDVWRLMLLTVAVLVCVLSFAASVRFLADGRLGPIETVRFMLYLMPPMLQYAVPFAAGFGATLGYHRWCSDNEVTACFAAGISHRSLLMPVVVSGIVLMSAVLALTNFVIPRFLRSAEKLVARDAAKFIIAAIERKESITLDNTMLYADLVRQVPDTGGGKYEKLYMKGVFFVRLGKDRMPEFEASAEEADIWLMREQATGETTASGKAGDAETVTRVIVRPRGVRAREAGKQASDLEFTVLSPVIPHSFNDNPKYLTWGELEELKRLPENLDYIEAARRKLAARLSEHDAIERVSAGLVSNGVSHLTDRNGNATTVHAARLEYAPSQGWVIVPASPEKPITIDRESEDGRAFSQESQTAILRTVINPSSLEHPVTLTLSLTGVRTVLATHSSKDAKDKAGVLNEFVLDGVLPPRGEGGVDKSLAAMPLEQLVARSEATLDTVPNAAQVADLRAQLDTVNKQVADLLREVVSKQQERLAASVACMVMTITGAVMALRLRNRLPLTVYLWSFFPALAAIITISAGQQLMHRHGPMYLMVLWGGVAGLMAYTFVQYRKVAIH